ncbi:MAG: PQQ-binding-like beta-propeller repeat protein [Myxococcota bacterium]
MRLSYVPALVAAAWLGGCNCGPGLSTAEADLQVVPLSLDFGAHEGGAVRSLAVELTNTGRATLTLTRVALEADARGAFTVSQPPATLAAGSSVSLTVRYAAPMMEGPDGASLLIESDARTAPQVRVSLAGRSVRATPDAGDADAGAPDDAGLDAGAPDSGVDDSGVDAGADDAGADDAGADDAGAPDAGVEDAGLPTDGGCFPRVPSGTSAVAYQVDIAHTGAAPSDVLRLPLCRRWQRDLGGAAGYPVVAGGRVYVVSRTNQAGYGNLLWALDQHTGNIVWGPVDLGGSYWWAALAYDAGRVFAVNASGFMRAVDAATGATLWARQLPGQYSCDSPPTATNGMVYTGAAGSGGTVYGLWAGDGGVRWTRPVANGNTSSPAVSTSGVYVSYACNQAWGFAPASGTQLWHHTSTCSGGGGKNVALYRGRVYTRDFMGNLVLDAATGAELGSYSSRFIPAFSGEVMITTPGTTLRAQSLDGGAIVWTFDAGTEFISTAPLIVGAHVIAATSTRLVAVNLGDGSLASDFAVAGVRGPDEQNVSTPLAGFAAADGMLFVPVGNGVEAY